MATEYLVRLIDGETTTLELKDREAVRRVFQNHGFWDDAGSFIAAGAILSIDPFAKEEDPAGE